MPRGIHRHRHIRITTEAAIERKKRVDNAPQKRKAATLRDARQVAALKAGKSLGRDLNPALKSWVSRKLSKSWRQVTDADLAKLRA
jgi:hypothetical protein